MGRLVETETHQFRMSEKSAPAAPDDLFSELWQADGSSFASEEIAHENSLVHESAATELAIGARASIQGRFGVSCHAVLAETMATPYVERINRRVSSAHGAPGGGGHAAREHEVGA